MPNRLNIAAFKNPGILEGEKICGLTKSEGFYLWTLLLHSNETQKLFSGKYLLKINWNDEDMEITTDGQRFKFKQQNGAVKIYDLGFNFITQNGLDKKFKPKEKYE